MRHRTLVPVCCVLYYVCYMSGAVKYIKKRVATKPLTEPNDGRRDWTVDARRADAHPTNHHARHSTHATTHCALRALAGRGGRSGSSNGQVLCKAVESLYKIKNRGETQTARGTTPIPNVF